MKCQVCNSSGRKTRFNTTRLVICQWCVNELSKSTLDVTGVLSKFDELVGNYVTAKFSKSMEQIRNIAINNLGYEREPTFLDRIFNHSKSKMIESLIELEVSKVKGKYIDEIEVEKNNLKRELLEYSESRPRVTSYINYSTGDVAKGELVKRTYIKIVNAYELGLISASGKVDRPLDDDWIKIRDLIIKEDKYKCQLCGKYGGEKHVHHIIPLSKKGTNNYRNLITLCFNCHDKQHIDFNISRNT